MEVFPDAKVILNVRDPERWYKSVRETIYQMDHIDAHKFPFNILAKLDGSSAIHDTISQLGAKTGKLETQSKLNLVAVVKYEVNHRQNKRKHDFKRQKLCDQNFF